MLEKTNLEKTNIEQWLSNVVIGLNLCPFAAHPWNKNTVRIVVFPGSKEEVFQETFINELQLLCSTPKSTIETSLLATPNLFKNFFDFNFFLEHANTILKREGKKGEIQIASFHPDFQFTGVAAEDKQNLTNRAPYPIFHLIREDSLQEAIEHHPNTESIYKNNIERMQSLNEDEIKTLFPYLNRR